MELWPCIFISAIQSYSYIIYIGYGNRLETDLYRIDRDQIKIACLNILSSLTLEGSSRLV